jgi:hypothetical protein
LKAFSCIGATLENEHHPSNTQLERPVYLGNSPSFLSKPLENSSVLYGESNEYSTGARESFLESSQLENVSKNLEFPFETIAVSNEFRKQSLDKNSKENVGYYTENTTDNSENDVINVKKTSWMEKKKVSSFFDVLEYFVDNKIQNSCQLSDKYASDIYPSYEKTAYEKINNMKAKDISLENDGSESEATLSFSDISQKIPLNLSDELYIYDEKVGEDNPWNQITISIKNRLSKNNTKRNEEVYVVTLIVLFGIIIISSIFINWLVFFKVLDKSHETSIDFLETMAFLSLLAVIFIRQ